MRPMPTVLRVLLVLLVSLSVARGGDTDSSAFKSSAGVIVKEDALTALRGAGHTLSAPLRWDGEDWLMAGGIGLGTAASTLLDMDARDYMQRNQSGPKDAVSNVAVLYGDGLNMIALSAGGYVAGLAFKNEWLRKTALLTGTAIVVAGTISTILKVSVGRARPYTNEGHMAFRPFSFSGENYVSFPSGHTIVAFAVSGVLSERIGNVWASIGLYTLAATTGYSRMYADQHWLSDIVFGAALSIAVSRSLVRFCEDEKEPADQTGFRIIPRGNGVAMVWVF